MKHFSDPHLHYHWGFVTEEFALLFEERKSQHLSRRFLDFCSLPWVTRSFRASNGNPKVGSYLCSFVEKCSCLAATFTLRWILGHEPSLRKGLLDFGSVSQGTMHLGKIFLFP